MDLKLVWLHNRPCGVVSKRCCACFHSCYSYVLKCRALYHTHLPSYNMELVHKRIYTLIYTPPFLHQIPPSTYHTQLNGAHTTPNTFWSVHEVRSSATVNAVTYACSCACVPTICIPQETHKHCATPVKHGSPLVELKQRPPAYTTVHSRLSPNSVWYDEVILFVRLLHRTGVNIEAVKRHIHANEIIFGTSKQCNYIMGDESRCEATNGASPPICCAKGTYCLSFLLCFFAHLLLSLLERSIYHMWPMAML